MFANKLGLTISLSDLNRGLYAGFAKVSPAIAQRCLERNFTKNRKKKKTSISKYSSDMSGNRWESATGDAIRFSTELELVDGQNRLHAIVESGKSIYMLFMFGVTKKAVTTMDQGVSRSAKDAADILGLDIDKLNIQTAKACYNGHATTAAISNSAALALVSNADYANGLEWLNSLLTVQGNKGVTTRASIRGAILRCYLYHKENKLKVARLEQFCRILNTGQYGKVQTDRIPSQLREKLLGGRIYGQQRYLYGLTEQAMQNFSEGAILKILKSTEYELYELEEIPTANNELAIA